VLGQTMWDVIKKVFPGKFGQERRVGERGSRVGSKKGNESSYLKHRSLLVCFLVPSSEGLMGEGRYGEGFLWRQSSKINLR